MLYRLRVARSFSAASFHRAHMYFVKMSHYYFCIRVIFLVRKLFLNLKISDDVNDRRGIKDDNDGTYPADSDLDHDADKKEKCNRVKALMELWRNAARRSVRQSLGKDPWRRFMIHELPTKKCIRHRYSAIRKTWSEDEVEVKMHSDPFARGAMRECYRLKKLSKFAKDTDWLHAHNYVAKKYIQEVDRNVLFEDVKLQMDSKLWAEEFNRHNPPKKIDIVQMCILEFIEEPGKPLFHLEHFIEGDYIKYNSNSGFVSEICRQTPQAFSHFTFERSGHQMIVVDIQGVGDLYTDPQIHDLIGGYGDGNLGSRGMALFFFSHKCNDICTSLCLTEFDLSPEEKKMRDEGHIKTDPSTKFSVLTHSSLDPCEPLVTDDDNVMDRLRYRTKSMCSRRSSASQEFNEEDDHGIIHEEYSADDHDMDCICKECRSVSPDYVDHHEPMNVGDSDGRCQRVGRHVRWNSNCSSLCSTRNTRETEREEFWVEARKQSRPAGLMSDEELDTLSKLSRNNHAASILGQIHLDIARYHELGRFLSEDFGGLDKENMFIDTTNSDMSDTCKKEHHVDYEYKSALFHLDAARKCGILEAVITIAQMAYGLGHDLLKDIGWDEWLEFKRRTKLKELSPFVFENDQKEDRQAIGFELMKNAADLGDRSAMLFVAEGYETGVSTGDNGLADWVKAIEFYEKVLSFHSEESDFSLEHAAMSSCELLERPRYMILKKMADMNREGGYGLEQNLEKAYDLYNEAAEAATEAMKGKLASKLYEMAELCAV
ncbi:hypothetical protein L596_003488 [Steinernema carpocapsae]|uniref:Eukaryotic elongation factor 2 kinase n=1 Tax=Steinernema carpocapsae TaxID=34508 RepID=A0A4U8USW1_STECR|nr:hypothetical protein L596_003488 [Steinernema carpocapsae]